MRTSLRPSFLKSFPPRILTYSEHHGNLSPGNSCESLRLCLSLGLFRDLSTACTCRSDCLNSMQIPNYNQLVFPLQAQRSLLCTAQHLVCKDLHLHLSALSSPNKEERSGSKACKQRDGDERRLSTIWGSAPALALMWTARPRTVHQALDPDPSAFQHLLTLATAISYHAWHVPAPSTY